MKGDPSGTANSNILGPWASTAPLMMALFSRLSLGFLTVMEAEELSLMGVAAKLTTFSDNSKAGSTPMARQGNLNVLACTCVCVCVCVCMWIIG